MTTLIDIHLHCEWLPDDDGRPVNLPASCVDTDALHDLFYDELLHRDIRLKSVTATDKLKP